ncbi:MAG: hypothetical protein IJD97_10740 [Clostridia bacterium]|nr:hypothetical protein [Clostridia bacterium]
MSFIVGYKITEDPRFISYICDHKDKISEVYFSWRSMKNGRNDQLKSEDLNPLWAEKMQEEDLKKLSSEGISLNLLLNGNCYGAESQSRSFFTELGNTIDYLTGCYSITSVTSSSLLIAKFIKENFPSLSLRASVNIGVGTPEAADYLKEYFDGFYLKREFNRNFDAIKKMRSYCDDAGKKLYMLANSGCFSDCPARTYHDNLVSHEKEISAMDNAYNFEGLCHEYLTDKKNFLTLIKDSNYVRPEDIHLYDGLFDGIKLATRQNPFPVRIMHAYLTGRYYGSVTELTEPDHTASLKGKILDNSAFPDDFGKTVASCSKNCSECNYCENVLNKVLTERNPDILTVESQD